MLAVKPQFGASSDRDISEQSADNSVLDNVICSIRYLLTVAAPINKRTSGSLWISRKRALILIIKSLGSLLRADHLVTLNYFVLPVFFDHHAGIPTGCHGNIRRKR